MSRQSPLACRSTQSPPVANRPSVGRRSCALASRQDERHRHHVTPLLLGSAPVGTARIFTVFYILVGVTVVFMNVAAALQATRHTRRPPPRQPPPMRHSSTPLRRPPRAAPTDSLRLQEVEYAVKSYGFHIGKHATTATRWIYAEAVRP